MSEYIKVAVDAMGGDYAPQEPVKGVVEALREKPDRKSTRLNSSHCG